MDSAVSLAKNVIAESIRSISKVEGLNISLPKIRGLLRGNSVSIDKDSYSFIKDIYLAWKFLFNTIDEYPIDIVFLSNLNKISTGELIYKKGDIFTIDAFDIVGILNSEAIIYELDKIKITDYNERLRALKYFCYIVKANIFIDRNLVLAQLIANKVLIEANIGVFLIPVEFLGYFKSLLEVFYKSGNDKDLIDFMLDFCIVDIK